jgi:hypothetical protein
LIYICSGLLSQAHTSFTNFELAKERFRAFQLQASGRLKEWIKSQGVFEADSTKRLQDRLDEIEEQAEKEVVDVIDQVADELLENFTRSSPSVRNQSIRSTLAYDAPVVLSDSRMPHNLPGGGRQKS